MSGKNISRRDFIRGIAAGAAGMAAAGILGGCEYSLNDGAASAGSSSSAAGAAAAGNYTPGTYTASAQGIGTVTMTATFDETSITDIVLDVSGETPDIGGVAADELIAQCLAAQSSNIDGVSGATLTTNAVKSCLDDCIAQANGTAAAPADAASAGSSDTDWLGEEPSITDADCTETLDCDVLVIGLGLAGVAAARSAAEEGARVIGVEKGDGPQCRSGEYAILNGSVQKRWGRDIYDDEKIAKLIRYHMEESSYKVKEAIIRKWAYNIGDVFDWWIEPNKDLYIADTTRADIPDENAGNFLIPIFEPLPEAYDVDKEQFPCYPTSVEFLPNQSVNVNCNMDAAVAAGCEARYGCFAEKLIMENGRCIGAYIRDAKNGSTYFRVNAAKGVILATGYTFGKDMFNFAIPGITGDGLRMAWEAGVDHVPVRMEQAAMMVGVEGLPDSVSNIFFQPNLLVNAFGKRFMNEDLPGQQIQNQIELQKNMTTWQIFDAAWPEQLPFMPAEHGGACYFEDYASAEEGPKNNATYRNYKSPYQLQAAIDDGRCITADTLEELAAKMYPDDTKAQETALKSIERYNKLAKEGYDKDFGKRADRMWALENPPYYADQFGPALLLVICGGLESDEDCHTLDADRNIIPGLYVAGNIQGNRFAHEYPITLKGISHSLAMYYGYVAGKNAVEEV